MEVSATKQFWPAIHKKTCKIPGISTAAGKKRKKKAVGKGKGGDAVPVCGPCGSDESSSDGSGSVGSIDPGDEDEVEFAEVRKILRELAERREKQKLKEGSGPGSSGAQGSAGPAPPPDAVPPVKVKKGEGGGGLKYVPYIVHSMAGVPIGYLLLNLNAEQIDAHCYRHGAECRLGCTYRAFVPVEGRRMTAMQAVRGRCLAFLVTWLRLAAEFEDGPGGSDKHKELRFCRDPIIGPVLAEGKGKARLDARAYVEDSPTLARLRAFERQPRPGESREPESRL